MQMVGCLRMSTEDQARADAQRQWALAEKHHREPAGADGGSVNRVFLDEIEPRDQTYRFIRDHPDGVEAKAFVKHLWAFFLATQIPISVLPSPTPFPQNFGKCTWPSAWLCKGRSSNRSPLAATVGEVGLAQTFCSQDCLIPSGWRLLLHSEEMALIRCRKCS